MRAEDDVNDEPRESKSVMQECNDMQDIRIEVASGVTRFFMRNSLKECSSVCLPPVVKIS